MENAVKAIYISAGMLLGVMILSVWVYLFRQGASLGQNYETDRITQQITAFNSQFEKYTVVTEQSNLANYGYAFKSKGNIPSDVITCANLAYNINKKNDFDEKNNIEIIVIIEGKKYYVNCCEQQPKNYFIVGRNRLASNSLPIKPTKEQLNNENNYLSFNNFLKTYNDVKIVNISSTNYNSSSETIYKYYFDVNKDENGIVGQGIHYSEVTGKVDKIIFTAIETKHYDSLGENAWRNI